MTRVRVESDTVHWLCDCGIRDRTPLSTTATPSLPAGGGDVFARIRFRPGGDVMLGVGKERDGGGGEYELLSLEEIVRLVSSEVPLADVLDEITTKIAFRMGVEVCSIYLNKGGHLVLSATHGLSRDAVGKVRLALGEGITGFAAKSRSIVAVADAAADPRYRHFPSAKEERYRAMLSCPIIGNHGRVVGVVNVQTVRTRNFTPSEIRYVGIVASLVHACLRVRDRVRDVPVEPPPDGR
jgi:phosphotransferase system enzyme I (PtsP)